VNDTNFLREVYVMGGQLSSRERMIAAIECREPDYVPLCFMIFRALGSRCKDQYEFMERQLELGLDAVVELPIVPPRKRLVDQSDLHGLPVQFGPRVQVREWKEDRDDEKYPLLHKEYNTPSGALKAIVSKAEDWPYGDHVPLFDDYLIPRSKKFLIAEQSDLEHLKHLLMPLSKEEIDGINEASRPAKEFAE
jgi:hypothetical protein